MEKTIGWLIIVCCATIIIFCLMKLILIKLKDLKQTIKLYDKLYEDNGI